LLSLSACAADGANPDELLDEISTCVLMVAGEIATKLNPCWDSGPKPMSKDPSFMEEIVTRPPPAKLSLIEKQIDAEIDAGTRKCEAFDEIFDVPGAPKMEEGFGDEIPQEMVTQVDEEEEKARRTDVGGKTTILGVDVGAKITFVDGWMPESVSLSSNGNNVDDVDDVGDVLLKRVSEKELSKDGEKVVGALLKNIGEKAKAIMEEKKVGIGKSAKEGWSMMKMMLGEQDLNIIGCGGEEGFGDEVPQELVKEANEYNNKKQNDDSLQIEKAASSMGGIGSSTEEKEENPLKETQRALEAEGSRIDAELTGDYVVDAPSVTIVDDGSSNNDDHDALKATQRALEANGNKIEEEIMES